MLTNRQRPRRFDKRVVIRFLVGVCAVIGFLLTVGFIYLPRAFEAKYTGPTITTADGKELITLVRLPDGDGPFPTLIVRSPYTLPHTPLSGMPSEDFSHLPDRELPDVGWAPVVNAGYALVVQHTRGRVGSEGLALDLKDTEDGLQLIEWVRAQPWSDGKIGTTGDSIEAILAMITNTSGVEVVDASYVQIGTPNLVNEVMLGPGGALKLELFLPWVAEQILTADDNHYAEMGYGPIKRRSSLIGMGLTVQEIFSDFENAHALEAWRHLPLADYPYFSEASSAWNAMLMARPGDDLATRFDASESEVPTYYVASWFDVFAPSQLSAFERGESADRDQRLLVLNGTHFSAEDPEVWPIQPMLPWFDFHLKGELNALNAWPRVIFPIANAKDEWFGSDTWPPEGTSSVRWHLSASGQLLTTPSTSGRRSYSYDPRDPVPTVGGRNLLISHGALDQRPVREGARHDVLSYESEVLVDSRLVVGHLYGYLSVSSDMPDTDFTMKILDVAPDGTATLVSEGIQRARFRNGLDKEVFLEPGEVYRLEIDLGHAAWRFKRGHRLAVDVSSSNFPQWDRNLNTDQPLFTSTDLQVAQNTVHHGAVHASYIKLPIVSDMSGLERLANLKTSSPGDSTH